MFLCPLSKYKTDASQGLISLYTSLQLAILLYWALGPARLKLQTAAAVLMFASGVLLLFVSHAEHTRSLHPSTLITVYVFLSLVFDCAIARTLWLLENTGVLARLVTTTIAVKLLVLVAEVWEKRSILLSRYQGVSPEMTSSILSLAVFWWLNPLLKTGFGRFLTFTDLYCYHPLLIFVNVDNMSGTRSTIACLQGNCSLERTRDGSHVCRLLSYDLLSIRTTYSWQDL